MDTYKVLVSPLEGEPEAPLGLLSDFSLTYDLESPVVSFSGITIEDRCPSYFSRFQLVKNETVLFSGTLDQYRYQIDASGTNFSFTGRSGGSVLLDNPAVPETLWDSNLLSLFSRTIGSPFSLNSTYGNERLPEYTVHQGTSRWKAFTNFCLQLTGYHPTLLGSTVYLGSLPSRQHRTYGNQGDLPFTRFEKRHFPHKILSKIYLRDAYGSYSSFVENPHSRYYQIQRERYLSPWGEDAQSGGGNARYLLSQSMADSGYFQLEVPQFFLPQLGESGTIDTGYQKERGLTLVKVHAEFRQGNAKTILGFQKEVTR